MLTVMTATTETTALPLVKLRGLDLIMGFVAVGRRMSVTQAANDLCVTQPAISRQLRELEDRLGVRLFVRAHRALRFTPEGERLFATADANLTSLQYALGALVRPRHASSRPPGHAALRPLDRAASQSLGHAASQPPGGAASRPLA